MGHKGFQALLIFDGKNIKNNNDYNDCYNYSKKNGNIIRNNNNKIDINSENNKIMMIILRKNSFLIHFSTETLLSNFEIIPIKF